MTHDQKDNRLSVAEVYRRADGICSVCGLRVPLACDRNDAWSRTKDHIVPLEHGGEHSYDNCQLAHRVCNSVKRQHGAGFIISWEERFAADPSRWGGKLVRLDTLLTADRDAGARGPDGMLKPPGVDHFSTAALLQTVGPSRAKNRELKHLHFRCNMNLPNTFMKMRGSIEIPRKPEAGRI